MIGDQLDMVGRLRALLPQGWFPTEETNSGTSSTAPVLYSLLSGLGNGLAWGYSFIAFASAQILIATSTDIWLDLHAFDFLGTSLLRRLQESDSSFLVRVQDALFPAANTRAALIARLTQLTGRKPIVFEPTNPADTGAYGYGGLGYGVAGGYGSLLLPFQAFVTAFRPVGQGVPLLAGYSGNLSTPVYAPLGYGVGLGSYVDIATAFDGVTDADIYATVAAVEPAGSIVWTNITS
ncbi:MAG: hypothetical protein P4L10_10885 [Acidobacteriaceae bacterium]|nr:hypothetical protein [Acidobacteriaceae bacterium]